jgi:DNA repair protein RecN (Recombination protein N)
MIEHLSIKDFAILDSLEVDFFPGLTVITGETGSGKSILVKAMSIVLGAKPTATDVRSQQDQAVLEIVAQKRYYRRIIKANGRVRSFIDDAPKKESLYRQKVYSLADFHGQHEQQYIMDPKTHIDFLDRFARGSEKVEELKEIYQSLERAKKKLIEDRTRLEQAQDRQALLQYQIAEIDSVNPQPEEDHRLMEEYKKLSHLDELFATLQQITEELTEEDQSVYARLAAIRGMLERLRHVDKNLVSYLDQLQESMEILQDMGFGLTRYQEALDRNPQRLQDLEARIQALEALKRKYGGSLESVLNFRQSLQEESTNLQTLQQSIEQTEKDIEHSTNQYQTLADALHHLRTQSASTLSKAIAAEMEHLHMPGARFKVDLTSETDPASPISLDGDSVSYGPKGYDRVEFYLSANPGERLKPLAQIASGGEVSRIMLAIKTIFQDMDPVNTLIFDEIDTGISGQAAEQVAANLQKLAQTKQVICVTHLPQIASVADHHLHLTKTITRECTSVSARYLEKKERVEAIAQLFSGSTVTMESLETAKTFVEGAHG